ncbi:MAG: aminotransferase class I/II-fold pyridoxal phosphate-dependent enzyme, partial [Kiloniellales bacterium]
MSPTTAAPPVTRLAAGLPATTPFVGPEAIERRLGRRFALRLGANESAFGCAPAVRAVLEAETARVSWYCDPAHHELREKLAGLLGVARANIAIGEGIDGLLGLLVRSTLEPGEPVVVSAGSYPTFAYHVNGYGGRLVAVPYRAEGANDLSALAAAATREAAKLVYLANPDNPTGSFLGAAEIARLLDALPENCLLALDEAYAEFAPRAALLPLDAEDPRLLRFRTFSKAHGLAGLRIGYVVAAPATIAVFEKLRLHFGVGRLSQLAAAAALDAHAFAEQVVAEVERGRRDYQALGQRLGLPTLQG